MSIPLFFVYVSADGHLDHLHIWAIVINASMNMGVQKIDLPYDPAIPLLGK